MGSKREKYP